MINIDEADPQYFVFFAPCRLRASVNATQFRQTLFQIFDERLDTGETVRIERGGGYGAPA